LFILPTLSASNNTFETNYSSKSSLISKLELLSTRILEGSEDLATSERLSLINKKDKTTIKTYRKTAIRRKT